MPTTTALLITQSSLTGCKESSHLVWPIFDYVKVRRKIIWMMWWVGAPGAPTIICQTWPEKPTQYNIWSVWDCAWRSVYYKVSYRYKYYSCINYLFAFYYTETWMVSVIIIGNRAFNWTSIYHAHNAVQLSPQLRSPLAATSRDSNAFHGFLCDTTKLYKYVDVVK